MCILAVIIFLFSEKMISRQYTIGKFGWFIVDSISSPDNQQLNANEMTRKEN